MPEIDQFSILLVEDNESDILLTRRAFRESNLPITIQEVSRGRDAIRAISSETYDVVVLDHKLPDMDGIDVLHNIVALGIPVVMVTGNNDTTTAVEALKSGAADYLIKEEGYLRRLPQAVFGAVVRSRLDKEVRRLNVEKDHQNAVLQTVLDVDPGAIMVIRSLDLCLEIANPKAASMLPDFEPASHIGMPVGDVFPETIDEGFQKRLRQVLISGQPYEAHDVSFQVSGKGQRYFHTHFVPVDAHKLPDERGVVMIMWDTTEDVRSRQKIEQLAREKEARSTWLQTVLDQMPEGIHIASAPDAQLLLSNRAADEVFGRAVQGDLSGDGVPQRFGLTTPDGKEVAVDELPLQRAIWKGEYVTGQELRVTRPDGSSVDLLVNASPIYDAENNLIAGIAMLQDITRIKDVERIKDEFVSIAGHELRTPLTSVLASGQLVARLIKQHEHSDKEVAYLDSIIRQSKRMSRLIEEMLDISRLQTGTIPITLASFDMVDLGREAIETCCVANPTAEIKLYAPQPVWVVADRDRIGQVLGNLLDNAVKYGRKNGSLIEVQITNLERGAAMLEVRDDGLGFDSANSEKIFERFSRLGNITNHSKGMGLGLYISRHIIEAHGGKMSAHSDGHGHGATFTVHLPGK